MIDRDFYAHISNPEAQIGNAAQAMRIYWTSSRKAALVAAIADGKIALEEARRRYRLSEEELDGWVAALLKNGTPGLRATRFQIYRDHPRPAATRARELGDRAEERA